MGKYMRKAKITGEVTVMDVSQASLGVRTRAKTLALQRDTTSHLQKTTSYLQLRSRRLEKPLFSTPKTAILPKTSSADKGNQGSKQTTNSIGCTANPRLGSVNSGSGSIIHSCSKTRNVEETSFSLGKPYSELTPESETAVEASFGENVVDFDSRERGDVGLKKKCYGVSICDCTFKRSYGVAYRFLMSIRETTPSSLIRASETLGTPGSTTRPTNSTGSNRRVQSTTCRNIPTAHEMEEFFAGAEQQQQRRFTEKYNYDPMNDMPLPGRYEWVRLNP